MKRFFRSGLAVILAATLLMSLAGCGAVEYTADQSFLYGLNYVDTQMSDRLTVAQIANLSQAAGAKSVRLCAAVMETGTTMFSEASKRLHDLLGAFSLSGIDQVIVQMAGFPQDGAIGYTAPDPDLEDGEYLAFLEETSTMVAALAKEYPEVNYWQIGHQLNNDRFLHPIGWQEENSPVDPFTVEQKAAVTVDLQKSIVKALRDAGSEATVLMADMADQGKEQNVAYLKAVYDAIRSGEHGSKDVTDFFDAVSFDMNLTAEPDEALTASCNALYDVVKEHKDAGRKVYISEIGIESPDDQQATHAAWLEKVYALAKELSYVESVHWYRMFNDGAERFGLFNEPRGGFAPTEKGKAFAKCAGGTGDLERYVIKEDQYSSGDNVALNVPTAASSSCEHPGWGWSLAGINNGTLEYGGWSNYYEFGTTEWATTPSGNGSNDPHREEWVEFYLPYFWTIDTVLLYPRGEIDENFHQVYGLPREVVIEVSDDGKAWTKVGYAKVTPKTYAADVTNVPRAENPAIEIKFDAVKTKNVRVSFPTISTNWQHYENNYFVQLEEIQILMH